MGNLAKVFTGHLRGRRAAPPPVAEYRRDLIPDDVTIWETKQRGGPKKVLKHLRDSHHNLAKLVASGISMTECARLTGYNPTRISMLKNDPAFADLVSFYRMESHAAHRDVVSGLGYLSLDLMSELQRRLDEDPDSISVKELTEALKTTADRAGYGPTSTTKNLNVNVGLADKLRLAREKAKGVPLPATVTYEAAPTFDLPDPVLEDEDLL